jgi:hypothetical protein
MLIQAAALEHTGYEADALAAELAEVGFTRGQGLEVQGLGFRVKGLGVGCSV